MLVARWFLDVLGYQKTSPIFLINGVAMAGMFFLVRIASIPPYWYKVGGNNNTSIFIAPYQVAHIIRVTVPSQWVI